MKRKLFSKVMAMMMVSAMGMSMAGCGGEASKTADAPASEKPAESTAAESPAESPAENAAAEAPMFQNTEASLVVWGSQDDQQMLNEMVDAFKAEYPEVAWDITVRVNGEDQAKTEVLKDTEAAADVFAIAHDQLGELVQSGAVYKNTKYADDIKERSVDAAINAATYEGELYGYPSVSETYFLFYNKAIFNEEQVKSLDAMLTADLADGVTPFAMDVANAYYSGPFFLSNGCELFGADGSDAKTVTFNNAQGLEVAKLLGTLKGQGVVAFDDTVAAAQFEAGTLGAYVAGPWKTETYKGVLGDNFGVAELPSLNFNGEEKHMASFAGFKIYCVKSNTKYPLEAMALANWLTNEDNQLKRFQDRGGVPVSKALSESAEVTSDPAVAALLAQLNYAYAMPAIPQMGKFWDATKAFVQEAFDGTITEADYQAKLDTLVATITEGAQ
ncbi:MAG: extracellular solute-binding protein [Cellulosilyticum sp.]|nr:extracellular solute-binding protein [Cellulosilyticum sp.]